MALLINFGIGYSVAREASADLKRFHLDIFRTLALGAASLIMSVSEQRSLS